MGVNRNNDGDARNEVQKRQMLLELASPLGNRRGIALGALGVTTGTADEHDDGGDQGWTKGETACRTRKEIWGCLSVCLPVYPPVCPPPGILYIRWLWMSSDAVGCCRRWWLGTNCCGHSGCYVAIRARNLNG